MDSNDKPIVLCAPTKDVCVHQADALEWLYEAAIAMPGEIDLIITDPPYWSLDKWRNMGTTTRLGGHKDVDKQDESRWFSTIDQEDLCTILYRFYDLMADGSFAYIFCDHEVLPVLLGYVRDGELGFSYSKPLVWDKVHPGMGYHWRAQHEYIVLLQKGRARLRNLSLPDVLRVPRLKGKQYYPTEKPLELISMLIENSSDPGDSVLDPFCGSGVVGEACRRLGRAGLLLDIADAAIECTQRRLANMDSELFARGGGK